MKAILILSGIAFACACWFVLGQRVAFREEAPFREFSYHVGVEVGKELVRNSAEAAGVGCWREEHGERWFTWGEPNGPYAYTMVPSKDGTTSRMVPRLGGPYRPLWGKIWSDCAQVVREPSGEASTINVYLVDGSQKLFAGSYSQTTLPSQLSGFKAISEAGETAFVEQEMDAEYWLARRYVAKHMKDKIARWPS